MTVAIIDYGMGNLGSVSRAVQTFTSDYIVTSDASKILEASKAILPGVGSFPDGMNNLKERGLDDILKIFAIEKNKPILGICLGMQLFASSSMEIEKTNGLNLIEGNVISFKDRECSFRLPHVGWNALNNISEDSIILEGIPEKTDVYFVHSFLYKLLEESYAICSTNYDVDFPSAIKKNNIYGTQFHPEKSSKAGMRILKNFLSINVKD